jgi:type III protein arginine methyltransferase
MNFFYPFRFSFSGKEKLLYNNKSTVETIAENSGNCHAIFMWWICNMDWENEIILSCAPKWAHHDNTRMQVSI